MNYRYVSVPTAIEAFQMTRERRASNVDWPQWLHKAWNGTRNHDGTMQIVDVIETVYPQPCDLEIITLEGAMRVRFGDWIIFGTRGELYPCKPDVFARKYREDRQEAST